MNNSQDITVNTVQILSKENSSDINSGALVVDGGISCKRNMYIKNALFCNNITVKNSINGIEENVNVNFNIIPTNKELNIGSNNYFWNNIYSKEINSSYLIDANHINATTINVSNNIIVGSSTKKLDNGLYDSVFEINSKDLNNNTSIVNKTDNVYFVNPDNNFCYLDINSNGFNLCTDLIVGNPECPIARIDIENSKTIFYGDIITLGNGIIKNFKKIKINSESNILDLEPEIIILKLDTVKNINLEIPKEFNSIPAGICKKIIIENNTERVAIKLIFDSGYLKFKDSVEIMFDGYKWIIISNL